MDVTVAIPAHNKREYLPDSVPVLLSYGNYRRLAIADGSPDGIGNNTETLVRQHPGQIDGYPRTDPHGLDRSYIDGFGERWPSTHR